MEWFYWASEEELEVEPVDWVDPEPAAPTNAAQDVNNAPARRNKMTTLNNLLLCIMINDNALYSKLKFMRQILGNWSLLARSEMK